MERFDTRPPVVRDAGAPAPASAQKEGAPAAPTPADIRAGVDKDTGDFSAPGLRPTVADPQQRNTYTTPVQDGGGLRYNEGKCRVELIPPEWPWALGMVLTRGAIKYADRNWERGMSWAYMLGSTLRHVFKFMCGERYDKESGNHHMAHAAWNCLGMMSYDIRGLHAFNDVAFDLPVLPPDGRDVLERTYTQMGPELMAKALEKQRAQTNKGA